MRIEYGQSSAIDDAHVGKLMESLSLRPPREPIKVTVWENEADKKFYILSGQHISMAIKKLRDQREKAGLALDEFHKVVRADVLKFLTPISLRKIVSGSENASSRVMRETTVSECLKNFMAGKSGDEVHDRVTRAVEQPGLNIDTSNPVCLF